MEKDELNYYFSIVGDIELQSDVVEKIFNDLGVFDTKTINENNKKSFINFISYCIDHQTYQKLSDKDISELMSNLTNNITVSANWSIVPPKYINDELAITYFRFKKEEDKERYLAYYILGKNYHDLKD